MLRVSMHQPNYLPYTGFFDKIAKSDIFVIVDHVTFSKGRDNWHHRNRIRTKTPPGWDYLTVPVSQHWNCKPFREASISNAFAHKRRKHIKTMVHNYQSAPFFDEYFGEFAEIYCKPEKNLAEFNIGLIEWFLEKFRIKARVLRSSELDFNNGLKKTDMIIALMRLVEGKVFICGDGARGYIERDKFQEAGIDLEFQNFRPEPYPQVYPGFIPNLSAFDLLMNTGKLEPNGQQLMDQK